MLLVNIKYASLYLWLLDGTSQNALFSNKKNRKCWYYARSTGARSEWPLSCNAFAIARFLVLYSFWTVLRIGGVFEHDIEQQVRAVLSQAVDDVNTNMHLLPGIKLHLDLEFIPAHDSFAASRAGNRLCWLTTTPPTTTITTLHVILIIHVLFLHKVVTSKAVNTRWANRTYNTRRSLQNHKRQVCGKLW